MTNPIDITTPAAFEQACADADSQMGGLDAYEPLPDNAEVEITHIGAIDRGIDGRDLYLLLTRKDDDMTPEQAQDWLLSRINMPAGGPGRIFLQGITAVQAAYSTDQVICTVQKRYDV